MKDKISSNQFGLLVAFILRSSFLGIASYVFLKTAKQDSWISVLFSFLIGFIPLLIFLYIHNYNPKFSIMELCDSIFGKVLGKIILIIFTIFIFFIGTYGLLDLTNFINSQYLNRTPTYFIAISFMIAIVYMLSKGLKVLVRTSGILVFASIILLILSIIGLGSQIEPNNLKPLLENGFHPVFQGTIKSAGYMVLPLFMLLIIPKSQIEDPKKTTHYFILYYILGFLTIFIVMFFVLSIFGIELATIYQYPEFHLLKLVSLVGILDRVEGVLSLQWIFDLFIFISFCYYFVHQVTKYLLKIKKQKPNIIIICLIAIGSIILSETFFQNNTEQNFFILNQLPNMLYLILGGIPLLIFCNCFIRKIISNRKKILDKKNT